MSPLSGIRIVEFAGLGPAPFDTRPGTSPFRKSTGLS